MTTFEIFDKLETIYFSDQMAEKEVIDNLASLIADDDVFVDVGASIGQYTYFANKCLDSGKIIAIEADPIRFKKLQETSELWTTESSNIINCIHAAASDADGKCSFFTSNSTQSGKLFCDDTNNTGSSWVATYQDCLQLDSIFPNSYPDLIKIDVEGCELRVLKGCRNILKKGKTTFLIEVHDTSDPEGQQDGLAVFQYLRRFGYVGYRFFGRTLFTSDLKYQFPHLYQSLTVSTRSLP